MAELEGGGEVRDADQGVAVPDGDGEWGVSEASGALPAWPTDTGAEPGSDVRGPEVEAASVAEPDAGRHGSELEAGREHAGSPRTVDHEAAADPASEAWASVIGSDPGPSGTAGGVEAPDMARAPMRTRPFFGALADRRAPVRQSAASDPLTSGSELAGSADTTAASTSVERSLQGPAAGGAGTAEAAGFEDGTGGEDDRSPGRLVGGFSDEPHDGEGIAGQPTRAADDSLSLDHLFRGQAPEQRVGDYSFDDFFTEGAGPGRGGSSPAGDVSGERATAGQGGESDLDAFKAWLEGLKR